MPAGHRLNLLTLLGAICVALALCSAATADGSDDFRIKSAESLDKVVDFLITLDLALFGLVGFFVRNGLSAQPRLRRAQIAVLVPFALVAGYSLFCGYRARLDMIALLASGSFPFESVPSWSVYQAIAVVGAGVLATVIVGLRLSDKTGPPGAQT